MIIIKDKEKGLFEIKVDTDRKIIYEKNINLWQKEDFIRYTQVFKNELIRDIKKMGKWAKVCDLRDYKTSAISDEMNEYSKWAAEQGLSHVATIVNNSALIKMQINRVAKEIVKLDYFDNEAEANAWLKSVGY